MKNQIKLIPHIKSIVIVVLMIIVSNIVLVSCNKEENEEPEPKVYLPELTLQQPDSTDFEIGVGEIFQLSATAMINEQSTTNLSNLQIMRNYNNAGFEVVLDSAISDFGKLFLLNNHTCIANENEGTEVWKIIVSDDAGGTDFILLNTEVVDLNPVLNFKSGEYEPGKERINEDTTLTVGQEFVFGIDAESGSIDNLRRISIERIYENASFITMFDSIFNQATYSTDIYTFTYPIPGIEEFRITMWDQSDRQSSISFTITTMPIAPNITTYEDVILGAQGSATGIAFATLYGTVYSLTDAMDNSAEIDWLYYFGATNSATIAAPDNVSAATVYNHPQYGLQNWDVLNSTKFKPSTLTGDGFDQISSSTQLVVAATFPTSPDQSKINNLSVGDVLAFETADEKYGLIRIDNIIQGDDGSIDITVKIQ